MSRSPDVAATTRAGAGPKAYGEAKTFDEESNIGGDMHRTLLVSNFVVLLSQAMDEINLHAGDGVAEAWLQTTATEAAADVEKVTPPD